jgi:hypothetical protein
VFASSCFHFAPGLSDDASALLRILRDDPFIRRGILMYDGRKVRLWAFPSLRSGRVLRGSRPRFTRTASRPFAR